MTRINFNQHAAYNRWANARLYAAALALPDRAYRRHIGVFFRSLHGTLNHLLLTDRLWLGRLTNEGTHPDRLDAIIHDDRRELAEARAKEDERILTIVSRYDDADLDRLHAYRTTSGQQQQQRIADILLHLFNHQTHHRGQAHACLSILTGQEPPSLDLLAFQRGAPAPPDCSLRTLKPHPADQVGVRRDGSVLSCQGTQQPFFSDVENRPC